MTTKPLSVVCLLLLLAACSSTATQEAPMPDLTKKIENPEMARVWIFRQSIPYGADSPLLVDIDGEPVASLRRGTYLVVEIPPGDHGVRLVLDRTMTKDVVGNDKLDLSAGRVYPYEVRFPLKESRRPRLVALTEEEFALRRKEMKPAGN